MVRALNRDEQPRSLHYRLLRSSEELRSFYATWQKLWATDREATPFQHPAWLFAWWEAFGEHQPGRELCCVIVSEADAQESPTAFLPFYIFLHRETGERQLLLLGAGTSDYLDGVFAHKEPEERQAQARAALLYLLAQTEWDVLYAAQLRSEAALLVALQTLSFRFSGQDGSPAYVLENWTAEATSWLPAVRLSDLPVKIRRNVLYYRNRALREGELTFRLASEEDCLNVFEELVFLHRKRWQSVEQEGVLSDPAVLMHHHSAVPALARAGLLRLAILKLGGETLGVLYSLIDAPERGDKRTQYFYLPAFSVAHAEFRPGSLLNALAIDAAAQEGVQTIDLLRGNEPYKQLWHAETRPAFGITLRRLSSSPRNLAS